MTGLTTGTTYTFQVKARNGGSTETSYGATASGVPVAAPTVTTLISGTNPSAYGQSVTFTAIVTNGASGTVVFKDGVIDILGCGSVGLSSGSATCTTSVLSAGSHSITAVYSGDDNYSGSISSEVTQMVATVLRLSGESVAGYYSSIQDAYDGAVDGDIIQIMNKPFSEGLSFDREGDLSVLLQGGCK